jgi:hypothetical protein
MAQSANSLVPINPNNLMSIDPQKNWHRFPSPIGAGMVTPSDMLATPTGAVPRYDSMTDWIGGTANVDADADNDGETGLITVSVTWAAPYWTTQAMKAAALGTTMAVDVTKSYGAGARGDIEPFNPYPQTVAADSATPPGFLPSNQL